ncbi:MAG TPA: trypsin-like serine protease [Gaiellaceae bacterium]|nr:trypsin-like serine protease [Gaiellaceae bacterium]
MKKLLLLMAVCAAALTVLPGSGRAITGNFVPDNEHPYVGLVAFYDAEGEFMWRCSGSLLTDRVFLTAGHCTDQDAEESPVSARIWFHQDAGADYDPETELDPTTGYPDYCIEGDPLCAESTLLFDFGFDNFGGFPNIHDVGLIILPEDQAVELPEYGVLAPAGFLESLATLNGVTFTVSGYGLTFTNPAQTVSFRSRLMATTRVVNLNVSRNTAGYNLQLSGDPGGGRGGTCFGDSGGPTFYGGYDSNVIVGVTSWGFGFNRQTCGGVGFAFRTDTEAVINWILGIVEQYAPSELPEIEFAE